MVTRRQWLALAAATFACRQREEAASSSARAATNMPPAPTTLSNSAPAEAPRPPAPAPERQSGAHALAARYPAFAKLPWVALGDLPTRPTPAPALAKALHLGELWIQRDDRSSALFGGSKIRKLERLLADAEQRGKKRLVTFGGAGSNHAVATAAFGRARGFQVTVALAPQPKTPLVARQLAACLSFGAQVESIEGVADAYAAARAHAAEDTYVIAPGGTCFLGNLGLVDAAFELAAAVERNELPAPDVIVTAMGTMGSSAGLAFGLPAAGLRAEVLAVRCSSSASSGPQLFQRLCGELRRDLERVDPRFPLRPANVTIDAGSLGPGYGRTTAAAERAIALAREHAALELEATYTGKALAALVRRAPDLQKRTVLFWASNPAPLAIDPAEADASKLPEPLRAYLSGRS